MRLPLILSLLITSQIQANEIENSFKFSIGHYKKSGKVAERTIFKSANMLKQNYDLAGNLRIEVFVTRHKTETSCYFSNRVKATSENYFECVQAFEQLVKQEGGISEGDHRTTKTDLDLQFTDSGKGLN